MGPERTRDRGPVKAPNGAADGHDSGGTPAAARRGRLGGSHGGAAGLTLSVGAPGRFSRLVALAESVYGFLPDGACADYYRWLYSQNPSGDAIVGDGEVDGELVAHYALVPMPVWADGRQLTGGLGVNSLTRRDMQGRAVFARLVTMVTGAAARHGLRLTYVVPSSQAEPWFVKRLGFAPTAPLRLWVRPLRATPLVRYVSGAGWLSAAGWALDLAVVPWSRLALARRNPARVEIAPVDRFGPEFDALWDRARRDLRFCAARTSAHLQWRFGAVPGREYRCWAAYARQELVAYVVARVRELAQYRGLPVGIIADLFARPDAPGLAAARLLVARALRWLSEREVGLCVVQLTSPVLEPALKANGFFASSGLPERRALLIRSLDHDRDPARAGRELHFAGGDHDMG